MNRLRLCLLLFFVLAVSALAQDKATQPDPHKDLADRLTAVGDLTSQWKYHEADLEHGEAISLDDSSWQQVDPTPQWEGHKWTGGSAWFRTTIVVPQNNKGYDLNGADIWVNQETDDDIIVYVNGLRIAMGESLEPTEVAKRVKPGDRILLAIKVLAVSGEHHLRARLNIVPPRDRPSPLVLADELRSADALVATLSDDAAQRKQQLEAAYRALDLKALDSADQKAFDDSLRAAQQKLEPLRPLFQKYTIHATGNAHIDMAWLWPWSETVDVVRRTYGTALQLMDEYPAYTFAQSTAQTSAWLEEKYPDIFAGIQKRVKEGRWEIVGGMWVEPDLNMPDGESQVRQLLIGKRYFKEKFGVDVNIGWNPDSFGYNWQLPQIYKKSGVDYFVTQKIYWNDTTKFPYKMFWWQSPDGSRVLTYFPHDYVNMMEPVRMAKDLADYIPRTPQFPEMLHLYGIGDHGGGPTRIMLDREKLWASDKVVYPKLQLGTAAAFFKSAAAAAPSLNLPVWNSELYLEFHRGVYTTQAETKNNNRKSEELLLNAEKLSSIATLFGSSYPHAEFEQAWRKVLFNQFHDVAAGSGIAPVYKDATRDYADVRLVGDKITTQALSELEGRVHTQGDGVPVMVFNPLSWVRSDVAEAEVELPEATNEVQVRDASDKPALHQILQRITPNKLRVIFRADDVPSMGYKMFYFSAANANAPVPTDLHSDRLRMENEFLRVTVDPKTGCISSLFDKKQNKETLAPGSCGNLLQAFHDKPKQWDAWNIDADFEKEKWDLTAADNVAAADRGPLRASVRVNRHFQNSKFAQQIVLCAHSPYVEVVTDADWHEKHILIKAGVSIPATSTTATFEIPYGSIERPTTRNTPEEKAKFEVPALRWADISSADGAGVSLINENKYGYDARGNTLRLSLLRSPEWPDPHADEGTHHFSYAFYPHGAHWKEGTFRQGYQFDYKLIARQVPPHDGELPRQWSFLTVDAPNVIVTAIKQAEDSTGVLVRMFEIEGKKADVKLTFPRMVQAATETNLMEQPGDKVDTARNNATTSISPYEIKTVMVNLAGVKK
jgi:alpha-mannosidase